MLSISQLGQADSDHSIFRHSNFSNEFNINTSEGINARGSAVVVSNTWMPLKNKGYVTVKCGKIQSNFLNS